MTRILAALLLACALFSPSAEARPHRRSVCVPVYIEGAGTVRICAVARAR